MKRASNGRAEGRRAIGQCGLVPARPEMAVAPRRLPVWLLRGVVLTLALLLPFLWRPWVAAAHPLGNFTINRYSRIELSAEGLRVRYVLDMAEIPTFQAISSLDASGAGRPSQTQKEAYARRRLAEISGHLQLTLNGIKTPLRMTSQELQLLPGQAGLPTMRLSAWLDAANGAATLAQAGPAGLRLEYRDDNEPEKIGWREIVVRAADGVTVQPVASAGVPTSDVSDELRSYPEDMLASPLDVRQLRFEVALGASAGAPVTPLASAPSQPATSPSLARTSDGFVQLVTTASLTPPVILLALLTALLLGSLHALSPGHGKTIVGAYLVGSRGTAQHAMFLGLTVTAVHTTGVFALGLGTLVAAQHVVPERVYPWMSLLSGLLVLAMGVSLVNSRWRAARQGATGQPGPAAAGGHTHQVHTHAGGDHADWHDHVHRVEDDHRHDHVHRVEDDHRHDHANGAPAALAGGGVSSLEAAPPAAAAAAVAEGPAGFSHSHGLGAHTHVIPGADGVPLTWRGLLALGISGGLLPCPSALVVMLGAIALHRVAFGLVLIVVFSAGLAATLVAIGLLMVYSGRVFGRLRLQERFGAGRLSRLVAAARVLPVASAAVVAVAGLALSVEAMQQLSLPRLGAVAPGGFALLVGALAVLVALRRGASPAPLAVPAVPGQTHPVRRQEREVLAQDQVAH